MNVIKENLFFVVMGAVVLLALALFVVIVQPLRAENDRLDTQVQELVRELEKLTRGPIPNVEALRQARVYNQQYDNQLTTVVTDLSTMRLSDTLPRLPAADRHAPGPFKSVYLEEIAALRRRLSERGIETGPNTWYFWNWGEAVPADEVQRVVAAKEIALMNELISILVHVPSDRRDASGLGVVQVDRLEVNPGEQRTADYRPMFVGRTQFRIEPYFDVFPFILEVRMPVRNYEILLRELLQGSRNIPIYVRTVSMMRIEDDPRLTRQIPPLYIGVRVEGWALDYHVLDRRVQPAGLTTGGRGPARP